MSSRQQKTQKAAAKKKGQTQSRQNRQTAPNPAIIRLQRDLKPNEHHPLSELNEEVRDEQRQQVFAEILARLANGPAANRDTTNQ